MKRRILTLAALTSLSACALTPNEAIDDIKIGMSVAEAEAILGSPVVVRDLGIIEGTVPAKNIPQQCRTYKYAVSDENKIQRTDRYTWVKYSSGRIARYHDNGYGYDGSAPCHR